MTMIEILVTMCVLGAAFVMYSGAVISTNRQRVSSYESLLVAETAQQVIERMRSEPFETVYALYNQNPFDDPAGPGTAPGFRFDVPGLHPVEGAVDGIVGRVWLPALEVETRKWELRENVNDPSLGLPRDLNADSIIDGADHALDYVQLPVRVTVEWRGRNGPRRFEIDTMLIEYRK